jgi:hypothetical protein
MERHLQIARKLTVFIGLAALSLLLGACGGGGGGSGGSGYAQATGMVDLDAERISATDTNALAQRVGFVSLSWQAPTQRVDGESLSMSEIAGYRIYYGTGSGDYNSVLSVDQPYTFTILIDDLPVGTYYFAMTTVDTNGIESGFSREIARIVQS